MLLPESGGSAAAMLNNFGKAAVIPGGGCYFLGWHDAEGKKAGDALTD
jgi:hypothetical protein